MVKSPLYLGLISGTSADGIDVALASFVRRPKLLASLTHPYPANLRPRILALAQGDGRISLDELGTLDIEIARTFAAAARSLLQHKGMVRPYAIGRSVLRRTRCSSAIRM